MKILRVRFFNLNSLRGEHTVDFSKTPLSDAGLFAITGPTGAGKTTILDAITLALYGQVPRHEATGPEHVMSHGTGESWAEVEFEVNGQHYRSKWGQYRARKRPEGNLQPPSMELSERKTADDGAETWEFLETYKSKVAPRVAELSGLEYKQFLRSVLLAQGDFTRFLKAPAGERAQLLEKITDTKKYSDISRAAFERAKQETQQVEQLRVGLAGVTLLSAEEVAFLEGEVQDFTRQLETATTAQEQLREARQWHRQLQDLHRKVLATQQRQHQFARQAETLAPLRQRLALHQQAAPFATDHALLRQLETQLSRLRQETQLLQTQLPQLKQRRATAETTRTAARLAYEQATATQQQQEPRLREAELLDQAIATAQQQLQDNRRAYDQRNTECKRLKDELHQTQTQTQEARAFLQTSSEWLVRHGKRAEMVEVFAALTGLVQDWDRLRADYGQLTTRVGLLTKRLHALQLDEQRHSAAAAGLREQLATQAAAAQQAAATRDERLRQLHHHVLTLRQALAEKDARRETVRQLAQAHQLIMSHEQARQQLQPHTPCPLCGALEHPYAAGVLGLTNDALAREQQQVEELTQEAHALNTRVNHLNTFLNLLENAGGNLQQTAPDAPLYLINPAAEATIPAESRAVVQQLKELEQTRIQVENQLAQALTEQQAALRAQASAQHDLQEAQASFTEVQEQLPDVQKQLVSLLSNFDLAFTGENGAAMMLQLRQLETEYQTRRQQHIDAERKAEVGVKMAEKIDQDVQGHKAWLQEHRQGLVAQHDAIQQQQRQRHELLAEADVIQMRQQLATAVRLADQARQQADQQFQQHDTALTVAADQLRQREQDAGQQQATRETRHAALTQALQAAGLSPDPATLPALLLPETEAATLQAQLSRHAQEEALAARTLQEVEQQLQHEEARALTTEPVTALEHQLETSSQQLATLNQQLGQRQERLNSHRSGQERHSALAAQLENQQQEARRWRQLAELIGSADGKKFSEFAQGLTLARLVDLANRHLHRFSDRYRILRNPDQHLDLLIQDEYQAGAVRTMNSLSGGESFLVSLALALGLSELAGRKTQIDTLFIDEGFGTLDPDTLDIALSALEMLQGTGKTIGIISHVEALQERVSTQISVRKGAGGISSLQVVGFGEKQ